MSLTPATRQADRLRCSLTAIRVRVRPACSDAFTVAPIPSTLTDRKAVSHSRLDLGNADLRWQRLERTWRIECKIWLKRGVTCGLQSRVHQEIAEWRSPAPGTEPVPERERGTRSRPEWGLFLILAFGARDEPRVRHRLRRSIRACRVFLARRTLCWAGRRARGAVHSVNLPGTGGILGGRPGFRLPREYQRSPPRPGSGRGQPNCKCRSHRPSQHRSRRPVQPSTGHWKSSLRTMTARPTD